MWSSKVSGSPDSCLTRMRQLLPEMQGVCRKVGEYILVNPGEAYSLSIQELAARSGTSENAVSRFARSLGYPGYRAFSQALSLDVGRNLGVSHDHPLEIVKNLSKDEDRTDRLVGRVFQLEIECIRDTLTSLDGRQVERAVIALAKAPRILIIGTGSAAPLCQMAQYRFSSIGLQAAWTADPMVMVAEVSLLGPKDVVLGISYSGQSRATIEALNYSRNRRRATTVCITAARGSRISEFADIELVAFGPKVSVGRGQFSARVSGIVLLEAIATAVAVKRFGGTNPSFDELNEMQTRINNIGPGWKPARTSGPNPGARTVRRKKVD